MCVLHVIRSLLASRKLSIVVVVLIALTSALVSVAANKPSITVRNVRKRSGGITGALFFVLIMGFPVVEAACLIPENRGFEVKSAYAIDGDTLVLADGRHLRLIGVNTPEIGRKGKTSQPLAIKARKETEKFLSAANSLLISSGDESHDRYGRLLAHVSNQRGDSLEETLVALGLAYHIAIPPNLAFVSCLSEAEQLARTQQRGLWAVNTALAPKSLAGKIEREAGFQLLQGEVLALTKGKTAHWLNLDSGVGLRISDADLVYFKQLQLESLLGKTIEVRGWLIPMRRHTKSSNGPKWLMHLRHPLMLDVL